MPTEEEMKQFGAKPPEEPAPPPEARTAPEVDVSLWEMILGSPAFLCFLEDMYIFQCQMYVLNIILVA